MRKIIYLLITVLNFPIGVEASSQVSLNSRQKVTVYETAKDTTTRLTNTLSLTFVEKIPIKESVAAIFIDTTKTFQTIVGFGGAFTDASAETFYKLPRKMQQEFINAYYDKGKGIGYSIGRVPINSCDFSSSSYTYVKENDVSLSSFDISVDKRYKIPFIKEALTQAGTLIMYGTPWSPPAWMKTNNNMLRGGKLKDEYASVWAKYYVKFIDAYEKEGIPMWGISVQNEPASVQRWESCIYTAEQERDFIKKHLGPTMWQAGM